MVEIYFSDLNEKGKNKILEFFEMEDEKDGNFEISPLFILEKGDEEENKGG